MELSTAIRLIKKGVTNSETVQTWADFGAGTGLFTQALANCLNHESTIYAIDKDWTSLAKLDTKLLSAHIKKINHDFISENLDIELLDGIIIANALHFVNNKRSFLLQLKKKLKPSGKIIIIEYEMTFGNAWVPYPVNLDALQKLSDEIGLTTTKLDEEPSMYNQTTMYSALLIKQ
jgi:2-polyprenyl-3-methyl-5-hydroxy-6-metoxy-1,4-benzoquinol methylase